MAAALVAGALAGPAAGAQPSPTTTAPADTTAPAGDPATAEPRVVEVAPRVVDLTVRVAHPDGSELSVETPDTRTVTLATDVLFDLDRSDLNAEARARIDALAEDLDELGGDRTVTIEGHTDDQGDTAYNQGLSERRAIAVRSRFGIQLDETYTLEAVGYGETRPVVPNDSEENRALNRRVVVSFPVD